MPERAVRDRLIEAGVDLVARHGMQALSLREIARAAGVSHGAPRRYFPTHQDLLAAIAREGYADLGRLVAALLDGADDDPYAQLLGLSRLYLDFARTHQGMFELMFRHELLRGNHSGLREHSRPLFDVLVLLVRRAAPGGAAPAVAAGALWANLHGIAQLWLWGSLQMVVGTDDVEPLLRAALDAHLPR